MAIDYNANGGSDPARNFFLIPKVALTPGLINGTDVAIRRLASFPNCDSPSTPSLTCPLPNRINRTTRLVSQGRLRAATRMLLSSDAPPLTDHEDAIQ